MRKYDIYLPLKYNDGTTSSLKSSKKFKNS